MYIKRVNCNCNVNMMNGYGLSNDYVIAKFVKDQIFENIFCFLKLKDLKNCMLVCKVWFKILNDENNEIWRFHCIRRFPEEVLMSDLLANLPSYKTKLRAYLHAWSPYDCSRNIYIKPNGFTFHR